MQNGARDAPPPHRFSCCLRDISLGGYAPLLNRDGTTVYYVINPFRPWSATLEHIDQVLGETLGRRMKGENCRG